MKKAAERKSKIEFTALVVFVLVSLALAILAFLYGGMDFGVYYAAGRVTLQGGNPYKYQQLVGQIVSNTGKLNNPYYYAPWFTWLILPLALFSYPIARTLWAVINFVLWFWGLYNVSGLIDYPRPGWQRWGMYLLVTFVFAWSTWGSEQVGILIFFLFALVLLSAKHGEWKLTGVLLALLLFKPNITAIPVSAIALWLLLHEKKWMPIFIMAGTLAILLTISLILSPNWYTALFQPDKITGLSYTLDSTGSTRVMRYTTTLLGWLSAYGIQGRVAVVIYIVWIILSIGAAVWAVYRSADVIELTASIVLINFAVIPYALFYDYAALALTLFYANYLLIKKPSLNGVRYLANTLIVLALFVGATIAFRYWVVIALILFTAFAYYMNFSGRPKFVDES